MSSLTDKEVHRYIEEIVKGVKGIQNRLENDVRAMCKILSLLLEDYKKRNGNEGDISQRLTGRFKDIYKSLELHLKFHLGAAVVITELNTLGQKIGMTPEERDALPGIECAIDPGSKILEILSDMTEFFPDAPNGSESHANAVVTVAKELFSKLGTKNTFKPKVLTLVSHNGKWFVGSSVAVSHFLRPLCLYNRICDFKQSLKRAVIYYQPLETDDNAHWNSSSFWFKPMGYTAEKPPCQNCTFMFQNLSGFLSGTGHLAKEGVGETFLAACGEYLPTNQCLPNDAGSDDEVVNVALTKFKDKCKLYYQSFHEIVSGCRLAYISNESEEDESRKVENLKNAYQTYVKDRIHIFGLRPECNGSLRP